MPVRVTWRQRCVSRQNEDFGEVGVRISLRVEHVGRVAERNRHSGEALALGELAAPREYLGLVCRHSISLPTSTESGATIIACPSGNDAWALHPSYNVPNFHRIVVHGSTMPLEYLRVSVSTGKPPMPNSTSFGPFSWVRVQP